MIDLSDSPATAAIRDETRGWLSENLADRPRLHFDLLEGFEQHRVWDRKLFDAGLAVLTWPEAYGGRGASLAEWLAFEEEYFLGGGPVRLSLNGIGLLAPALFEWGTPEQLNLLRPMARGQDVWAQAWSEPAAGSDLAAVQARTRRDGDGWRLSGSKIWSSRAVLANRAYGLFRNGNPADRHRNLTYFLFDLTTPGISVRPVERLDGMPVFAEIFFDDVWVPDGAVLGEVGAGWKVAMSTTGPERGLLLRSPGRFLRTAERLLAAARELGVAPDSSLGHAVAKCWADADAYRLFTYATASRVTNGEEIGPESSLNKLFWSEMDVRAHAVARNMLGAAALMKRRTTGDHGDGDWLEGFLMSIAGPIYAGTNEIQRNIVAERVLGLPRGASG
jgi:alkylation response protein AidB-like acyl-CoA dehydrogenase